MRVIKTSRVWVAGSCVNNRAQGGLLPLLFIPPQHLFSFIPLSAVEAEMQTMELLASVLMLIALSAHAVAGNVSQQKTAFDWFPFKRQNAARENICVRNTGFELRFNFHLLPCAIAHFFTVDLLLLGDLTPSSHGKMLKFEKIIIIIFVPHAC